MRYVKFQIILFVCFFILIFAPFSAAQSQHEEPCPAGSQRHEQSGQSGCVRKDDSGHLIRVGRWQVRNPANQLVQVVQYNFDGKQEGETILFYPASGKIKDVQQYSHNEPDGVWESLFENGTKHEQRIYLGGKLNGLRKRWNDSGKPQGMECFVAGERRAIDDCSQLSLAVAH